MQSRLAVLVADDGDRLAVGRKLRFGNVPWNLRSQECMTMSGDIDPGQSPELRIAVRDGVDALAVPAKVSVAVSDRSRTLRSEKRFLSVHDVDEPQIALVDRNLLKNQDRRIVGRP